jgi:DNA-3-methyladenine glycosylase
MRFVPLPQSFYEPSAREVAPGLLGHWLIRRTPSGVCGGPIVETEAYLVDDPASHCFNGETARNRVMFGPPGRAYVYLIYGYHYCVNAVCHPPGRAEAVLIRAIEPVFGVAIMRQQRKTASETNLTNGPAKLCAALDITRALDAANLCDPASSLLIAENPKRPKWMIERGPMVTTTRVGLTKAADQHLRYYLDNSAFISRRAPLVSAQTSRRSGAAIRASKGR